MTGTLAHAELPKATRKNSENTKETQLMPMSYISLSGHPTSAIETQRPLCTKKSIRVLVLVNFDQKLVAGTVYI